MSPGAFTHAGVVAHPPCPSPGTVAELPPIVTSREVLDVRAQLAEVALGKRFLLQGGDCAERFVDCSAAPIEKKLKILLQMSLILTWGARIPTLRIGRIAGQFAKPRSSPVETVDGSECWPRCLVHFEFRTRPALPPSRRGGAHLQGGQCERV